VQDRRESIDRSGNKGFLASDGPRRAEWKCHHAPIRTRWSLSWRAVAAGTGVFPVHVTGSDLLAARPALPHAGGTMSDKPQPPKSTPKPKEKADELNEKQLDQMAGGRGCSKTTLGR